MENRREKVSLYGLRNNIVSPDNRLRGVFNLRRLLHLPPIHLCHANLFMNLLHVFPFSNNKIFSMTNKMLMKNRWKNWAKRRVCISFCSGAGRFKDAHGLVEWDLRESMDRTRSIVRAGTKSWHAVARFHSQTCGPGSCTTQYVSKSIPRDEGTSRAILDSCTTQFLY